MIKKHLSKIIFITLILLFSISYTSFVAFNGGTQYIESHNRLSEIGELFSGLGYFFLILVYARTILKLIVNKGNLWKRLEPLEFDLSAIKSITGKILFWFNKTHAYFGILAIVSIFLHCYFTTSLLDNLLLRLVLILLAWQGIFGAVLQFKYTPAILKRKSYLLHAQLFTGILLLILAGFGHLLLGD
ncbi:MAG: hypothetical protein CO073_03345 [Candidatus Komeilibacteria bacterium CG_4_9_14_0_8_um_filter_36_9]|uniref:Uncharacterized protein n=1 Tax=Candidatus Komeilibacteria bacterium CG_4_9_14_0_8_um_filter_36_9 TaxID=1974473 RepID=A0A2M8DQS5_9BACT|nr:MAG: hypothetical protein CO073_03345 [Candidatus Komeilibacteria bacterium CG_4_9_14_0_8_um_filter_36_9]